MKPQSLAAVVIIIAASFARADDWPQWFGPRRDGVWRETGIVEKFPEAGARIRWRVPIAAGYSGPAVAGGFVYVTDRKVDQGKARPANPFDRAKIAGTERVLCLRESDGTVAWQDEYPCSYSMSYSAGPRATPTVSDGKVYTLGGEGDLRCYTADTGKLVWKTRLGTEDGDDTPLWGFSASPLVDGDKLICVGTKSAVAIAFNKNTGKVIWKSLTAKEPGYCPPVIFEIGGKRQLIIWHPQALVSLDPETGETYWSEPHEVKMGLTIPTPRLLGDMLFVASAYEGSLMMKMNSEKPGATRLWLRTGKSERNTEALHSLMATPFLRDGYIYGTCINGEVRCLKAENGDRVWESLAATTGGEPARWSNAFIIPQGDRFFLANEHGDLIIARLTPKGYEEISRAHVLEPANTDPGRPVVWSHPAFANRNAYMRNDKEIVCVSLAADAGK